MRRSSEIQPWRRLTSLQSRPARWSRGGGRARAVGGRARLPPYAGGVEGGAEREDADGAGLLGAGSVEPRGSAAAFHIEEGRRSHGALDLGRAEAEAREEVRRREELVESWRYGLRVVGWGI